MLSYTRCLIAVLFFALQSPSLFAQGCCSGGTPLAGNLDLSASTAKYLTFRIIYDLNQLEDLVVFSDELEDKTRSRITNSILLRTEYAFTDKLAAAVLFSYVRQVERININNTSTTGEGLGDIVALLQYNLLNAPKTSLSFAGGFKAPTGANNRLHPVNGLLLNPDLQPGTGAWDFLLLGQYTKKGIIWDNLNFRGNITYRYTNEAKRFNQQQVYKFGNELQLYFGLANSFFLGNAQLNPQLMFRYRNTLVDQTNGGPTPNTGGHWGYIVPGVEAFFNQKLGIGLLTELPLYRRLDGIQLTTSYKITASLIYSFSVGKNKIPHKPFLDVERK